MVPHRNLIDLTARLSNLDLRSVLSIMDEQLYRTHSNMRVTDEDFKFIRKPICGCSLKLVKAAENKLSISASHRTASKCHRGMWPKEDSGFKIDAMCAGDWVGRISVSLTSTTDVRNHQSHVSPYAHQATRTGKSQ